MDAEGRMMLADGPAAPAMDALGPAVRRRFLGMFLPVTALLLAIAALIYFRDLSYQRAILQREARSVLAVEQQFLARECRAVRADLLYLARQWELKRLAGGDDGARAALHRDYATFALSKAVYDQIRYLDLSGQEVVRVNYRDGVAEVVPDDQLQAKADRYYYREALKLRNGNVFVSPFDLNVEHGQLETPPKPVIRFLTPVSDLQQRRQGLLVLNYLGGRLLANLRSIASGFAGETMLVNDQGEYLLAPDPDQQWGWLLEHGRSFRTDFPAAWRRMKDEREAAFLLDGDLYCFQRFSAAELPALDPPLTPTVTASPPNAPPASPQRLSRQGRLEAPSPREDLDPDATVGSAAGREVADPDAAGQDAAGQEVAADVLRASTVLLVCRVPRRLISERSRNLFRQLLLLFGGTLLVVCPLSLFWARSRASHQFQEQQLAASESRLRQLSSQLLAVQEHERRRLSRELHDELGQQVTAISLDLKAAARSDVGPQAAARLELAIRETEQLLGSLHQIASRVRPSVLDDLGLADAVESHLAEFRQRTGIQVHASLSLGSRAVPARIGENVFRILQEALANVAQHADAPEAWITMERVGPRLRLMVRDRGRGFHRREAESGKRLGLLGMRERVELLDGTFALDTEPGRGTTIEVTIPIPPIAPSAAGNVADGRRESEPR